MELTNKHIKLIEEYGYDKKDFKLVSYRSSGNQKVNQHDNVVRAIYKNKIHRDCTKTRGQVIHTAAKHALQSLINTLEDAREIVNIIEGK